MGIQLGAFVLGSGKTDLEPFQLAQPALAFGLRDAGQEVVADLDQAVAPAGLGRSIEQRTQASLNYISLVRV
ncbi:hypothetical protein [Streptomyces muensis]|uniref:Uncharacterized protein n=1 Tax=Streptomyces muensis TaxID=1077944 RepID=A0A9X1Q0J4_STRM4|nr:hypothetical protein [Streptomyces muensis]MCF1596882.1 hypothetical protein [Streptomyces muensis]